MSKMIPAGWKTGSIGKHIREVKERNGKHDDVPVLSVTNTQGFVLSEDYFDRKVYSKNLGNYKVVRKGQFAYNPSRLNVGSLALLKEYEVGLLSPMYVVFEVLSDIDKNFLSYWLTSGRAKNLIKSSTQGTVRDSVNYSALAIFPIFFPPLPEQRKIAAILSSVDNAIEKTKAVIEQTKIVEKGLMRKLLTRGIPGRHKKFKKTPIGVIPEEWEVVKFKEVLKEVRYGTSVKANTYSQGLPVLRIPNILSGRINMSDLKFVTLTEDEVKRILLMDGDIVIVRTNGNPDYVGRCTVIEGLQTDCVFASYLIRLRFDTDKFLSHFIGEYLRSKTGREQMSVGIRTSAGNYNINTQSIRNILVPVPPMNEQSKIIRLSQQSEIQYLKNTEYLTSLEQLKSALLQVLLTGEVRVKE